MRIFSAGMLSWENDGTDRNKMKKINKRVNVPALCIAGKYTNQLMNMKN